MDEERGISSFTQDLLERPSESEAQRERREIRSKKLEKKTKVKDPEKIKRRQHRRRVILVMFLIVLIAVGLTVRGIFRLAALNIEKAETAKELQALEQQMGELQNELTQVNSDEYVEQQARIQLHMIRPGEILCVVPLEAAGSAGSEGEAPEDADSAKPEEAKP
ncbi:MAG: septum formation initiator family protein [Clostridia bacterium]|nr:septum formation initiator family protein [Clostridia bacterium]